MTYRFANWVYALTPPDIPADVHLMARRAMLDTLGIMIAGGAHPDVKRLAGIWPTVGGACGMATVGFTTAETAALINGSAVVFPTVLTLAQETGASEEDARTAFIIGSEIAYVLADICTHQHYFHGWWSTITFGLVGATAAAARLLACDQDQTARAIGLAAAAAGGGKSVFGTNAKPFLVGNTAQRAIQFARFGASGLTGPGEGIKGTTGFLHLLNNDVANLTQADSLGHRWRLIEPGLLFKSNPVCSAAHAAIEEIARLTFRTGLSADDISAVKVEVPKLVRISLVHDRPETPAQAQFSLPFSAACAIVHGAVRLQDLNAETIRSVAVRELMSRVDVFEADDLSSKEVLGNNPESARVTITLNNNTKRSGYCGEAYGMPKRPLSDKDFVAKFNACLIYAKVSSEEPDIFESDIPSLTSDRLNQISNLQLLNIPSLAEVN